MTVIIPEGYGQFTLIYTGPQFVSGGGATVLGFGADEDPIATLPEFAATLVTRWTSYIAPLTDSNIRLERIHWSGPTTSGDVVAGVAGTKSGTSLPGNTAVLVSYTTSRKGRRGRGRSYFPGMLTASEVGEDGIITSTRRTAIQDGIDDFFPDVSGPDQVVLQRDEPGQVTPPITPPPVVTSRVVGLRAATQRRRLRR